MCHFSFTVISGALFVSARRYDSNMLANSREELVEVFDALDAELDRLDEAAQLAAVGGAGAAGGGGGAGGSLFGSPGTTGPHG